MAESGLSVKYDDLIKEVSHFLGYNADMAFLTEDQLAEVDLYIQAGVRQFYFPPAMEGVEAGYEWSFMNPTATIDTAASDAEQDLPDLCGRVLGDFFFEPDNFLFSIPQVSEAHLLSLRQRSVETGRPLYACVRIITQDRQAGAGQRLEVAWWPIPDAAYTLTYRYEAYSGKLTAALPYPLGGMRHGELIVESCLAVTEQRANDEKGIHWDSFSRLLQSGIAMDRKQGAAYYGHMGGDGSGDVVPMHGAFQSRYNITYKGATW